MVSLIGNQEQHCAACNGAGVDCTAHSSQCRPYRGCAGIDLPRRRRQCCQLQWTDANALLCTSHVVQLVVCLYTRKNHHAFLQASKGRIKLMSLLLQAGARVNARDATGSSPLHRYTTNAVMYRVPCYSTQRMWLCPSRLLTLQGLQRW